MATAYASQETSLTFGRNGTDPHQWLTSSKYPAYTPEQELSFLRLYIRTHRDTLHPLIMEALIRLERVIEDDLREEPKIKGKGPRGRHAPKATE